MIDHAADGIEATHVQAGVATPLADAGVLAGAVRADHTLGPAVGRRTDVVGPARADRAAPGTATLGVRPTWRGMAGVLRRGRRDRHRAASRPRVAAEAGQTVADRVVVVDTALCVLSAHARAWVDALVARACLVLRTFDVAGALGLALDVGVSSVRFQAGAHGHAAALRALGVDAARRWEARLDDHRLRRPRRWEERNNSIRPYRGKFSYHN